MTVTIPAEIEKAAVELSHLSGSTANRGILHALRAHFLPIPEQLKAEFNTWELASEQDFATIDIEADPELRVGR